MRNIYSLSSHYVSSLFFVYNVYFNSTHVTGNTSRIVGFFQITKLSTCPYCWVAMKLELMIIPQTYRGEEKVPLIIRHHLFVRGVLHACSELLESVFMGFFLVDQRLHVVLISRRENKMTSSFCHVTNLFQQFCHCPKRCGMFSLELPPQHGSQCISMIMNFFPMNIAFNFDNCQKLFRS